MTSYSFMMANICISLWIFISFILNSNWNSMAATNFCLQPLGMERRIIEDAQITHSTTLNPASRSGKEARLNNINRCWCCATASQTNQWVKVDLEKPLHITGIAIQGDPYWPTNYITKFMLKYSTNGNNYSFTRDVQLNDKVFIGATGQNQLITRSFEAKPFAARYVEFRPTERDPGGAHVCVRFELYGCSYVCNEGLGIEYGLSLPSGFVLGASSWKSSFQPIKGRLSDPSCWCANTNAANEYIQIDFGKIVTITGIAVQGSPTTQSWVKDFYMDYGLTLSFVTAYTEKGVTKLFVGNKDQNTIVVNWLKNRLRAKLVRVKPNTFNGDKCIRIEILGCDTNFIAEVGAENRVLEDSRFHAYASTQWATGRYIPKDGRLNNDRPWGSSSTTNPGQFWFKVDLGRIMLVNGIATQGDPIYGANFFSDYKLEFVLESSGTNSVIVKSEGSSAVKVFSGNTNNMGVKFNLLKKSPISARYIRFLKNTQPQHDYTLRIEIYARPQVCSTSFGMVAGESSAYAPTINVSGGAVPSSKAKINSQAAWCSGSNGPGHFFMYDLGEDKQISGIAIQGNPSEDKWVKTFKVQYGSKLSSLTTHSVGSNQKEFVGCGSRDLIVYNWFPTEITTRYLKIIPITSQTEACLRLNVYGCPSPGCFKRIGIESSAMIANSLLTPSTFNNGNEAYKGRFNSYTTWAACQFGSCSPKESSSSKPWIQLCLTSANTISAVIIQGHGDQDSLADVKRITVKYSYTASGILYDYKYQGGVKVFPVDTGRYGSKQIDFPIAIVAKCIRIKIESQTQNNQNVGLRWELLGCNLVKNISLSLSSSSVTISRGSKSSVTCSGRGQEGGIISFKTSGTALVNSDVYNVGSQVRSTFDINGEIRRQIEITAKGPSIASSYSSCSVMDAAQGLAQCQQTIECSLVYADIPALGDSKSFNVNVTGLIGKPQPPNGIQSSSITQTSAKITWQASVTGDFQVENYKVSIKKKSDGLTARPDQTTTTREATFNNLMPFTEYTVDASAKSVTVNIYSAVTAHHFRTDEGAATAPVDVKATSITDTRIILKWKQPTSLNGNLHQYLIKYKKSTDSTFLPVLSAGKNLSKAFLNLAMSIDYDFQLAASTKLGAITGVWSSIIRVKTSKVWLTVSGNLTVNEGDSAIFSCNITENYPITWVNELNDTLPSTNGNLSLNSVTRYQAGNYYCRATTGSGTILKQMATLTINYKPNSVQFTVSNVKPLNGSEILLNCSSDAMPKQRFTISYQTKSAHTLYDGPNGVYKIKSINAKSFGDVRILFICFSYNKLGNGPASNTEVNIQVPPAVRMAPNVETLLVTEGDHVQLKCEVLHGNPLPQITWTDSNGGQFKARGNALTFSSVNRRNAKTYTCTVKNYLAAVVNNVTLIVKYRPSVDLLLPEKVCEDQKLFIACYTDGVPTVNVKLFFKSSVLTEGIGFVRHEISKISDSQFGKYSCSVSNILGSQTVIKTLVKSNCNSSSNRNAFMKKEAEGGTFAIALYVLAAVSFILLVMVISLTCKLRRKVQNQDTNVIKNEDTIQIPVSNYTELQKMTRELQPYATLSPEGHRGPNQTNKYYINHVAESSTDTDANQIYDSIH